MATSTPTYEDQVWGSDPWCRFDYWQHPTRDSGGNPLLLVRHPGGGTVGSHQWYRDSANTDWYYLLRWLNGDYTNSPAQHWDVCSFTSAQRRHETTIISPSRSVFYMEAVRNCQRAIGAIKARYGTYGFDPSRVLGMGESYGATTISLSQLAPALPGTGNGSVWLESKLNPGTFDSVLRGVIHISGPVDFQNYSGTDYFHYSRIGGFFGTRFDDSTEFDNLDDSIKKAASVRQYFTDRNLANYVGMYVSYIQAGNGRYPLGDPGIAGSNLHDSKQYTDLTSAMSSAGVPFSGQIVNSSDDITTTNWTGSDPNTTTLRIFRHFATWMADQIDA